MMGGIMDGIALTLSSGLHLDNGYFLEGSWDNYFYTRQWNTPPELEIVVMPPTTGHPGGAGELAVAGAMAAVACAYGRATGTMPTTFPINHGEPLGFEPLPTTPPVPRRPHRRSEPRLLGVHAAPNTFILNGKPVTVDIEDDVRLLWVLRDVLGVTGPKYGCGLGVCQACTSHINGKAFNPVRLPVKDIGPDDEITTIEGLPATRRQGPAPDAGGVASITTSPSAATAARPDHGRRREGASGPRGGREIGEAELDEIRNICRCGTYHRIREAIVAGAAKY